MASTIQENTSFWCSFKNEEVVCSTPLILTTSVLALSILATFAYGIKACCSTPEKEYRPLDRNPRGGFDFSKVIEGIATTVAISAGTALLAYLFSPPVAVVAAGAGAVNNLRRIL